MKKGGVVGRIGVKVPYPTKYLLTLSKYEFGLMAIAIAASYRVVLTIME